MAKVSIIIPTYNVEPYLRECMESITHQTLEDIEIICINDGSTDNSLKILEEYAQKDKRIILIDKENGGYGVGVNIGMDRATGEYIGILEPDDYVALNMFGDLYSIAKDNDLDFVKADFYRFTREENGNMYMIYNHLSKNQDDYNKIFNPSQTPEAIRFIMNTWSGIYKRDFLNSNGIRHNETPGASFQDNGFWFQTFVFATRAMIIDRPYYRNRRDNPNSSVKDSQKVYSMNVEYDHIRDILMAHPDIWNRFKYIYSYRKFFNYVGTVKRIDESCKMEYIERMSEEFNWAVVKGEIDESLFVQKDINRLHILMNSPKEYYKKYGKERPQVFSLKDKLERTEESLAKNKNELNNIKNTTTFKVGKGIMFIPHNVKKIVKKVKKSDSSNNQ